jgi:hypothetical protein
MREVSSISPENHNVGARALGTIGEHDLTRFLRGKGVPASYSDVFDIIIYILREWIGIELKENNRKQEKWNLTVHTNTWKSQMELARKNRNEKSCNIPIRACRRLGY